MSRRSKIRINRISTEVLKDFLSKLVTFDKYAFIKITDESCVSNVYLPNRDAVKSVEVATADMFDLKDEIDGEIKITFFNLKEIISILNFFGDGNTEGVIEYVETEELGKTALRFIVKNDEEKFNLFCVDPNFSFTDISDDNLDAAFEIEGLNSEESDHRYFTNFSLDYDTIKRIDSRLRIDREEANFTFKVIEDKVFVTTPNNELLVSDDINIIESDSIVDSTLYKKYLSLLDKENYTVHLCSNKVIFESLVSNTKLVISVSGDDDEELDDIDDLNDSLEMLDDMPLEN